MARPTGPEPVEAYDMEHLTGDLVGLLDHLQDRQGDLRRPRLGRLHCLADAAASHPTRVAGVVGVNTPHCDRAPADPIELFRQRFGDSMYIVQFQDPAREPDRIFGSRVEQTFDAFMRKPVPRSGRYVRDSSRLLPASARRPRLNLAFPQMIAALRRRNSIRARRSCRRKRRRCSSMLSPEPASPAASTGTAISRATGSARKGSTIPSACRR